MCTIVDAVVPARGFALQDAFAETPGAEFETVRTVAHDTGQPIPYLRATAPEPDAIEAALRADATTDTVQRVSRTGGHRLYRVDWQPRTRSLLGTLVEGDGTLLEADARDGRWEFELLFPDHPAASRTYNRCQDRGIELTVQQVTNDADPLADGGSTLSNQQQEAVVTAFEADYYRVPRGATQVELAQRLDLSHQALSERLRRGHQGLISDTVCRDTI